MAHNNIDINKLDRNHTMTVNVRLTRQFRVRTAIAISLVRLASWVLGCGINVKTEDQEKPMNQNTHQLTKGQALVITGKRGSGKTTLAKQIAEQHGTYEVCSALDLHSEFALGGILAKEPNTIIVEELPLHKTLDSLKQIIASDEVVAHLKHQEDIMVKTPNFIFCTSDPDALKLEGERRFRVLEVN